MPIIKGKGERILVAEGEPSLLLMMQELLAELGFVCLSARSGTEALALIEDGVEFDLLLTDIVMPGGIGGFELAKKMRTLRPDMPIVYMSGYTGFTSAEMGSGVAPMVQKPCPPSELAEVLVAQLARRDTKD